MDVALDGVKYVGCVWLEGLWWEGDENGASIFAGCGCGVVLFGCLRGEVSEVWCNEVEVSEALVGGADATRAGFACCGGRRISEL